MYEDEHIGRFSNLHQCTFKTTNKTTFNNEKLAELHKPILRKLIKRTVYSGFKDNIWGADLANMQLISKFNKGFSFIMCY